jgi:serine/threonine-protein kinase
VEPGSLIADRYRLDESIASGGMGTVWRGFDTRLKRAVAVKILKSGFERDDAARARFEHEAQAVASLHHSSIAALYDYGETVLEGGANGGATISYLVMQLVKGKSLTARLLDGPLDPAEAMRLCTQIAEALECAHEAGIIHRDVKPANIIIDERGRAVLVDFGIALSAGRTAITESGMLLGTLYYASPEQLEGRELTVATDVYSLGAVAYECLVGNPPFVGGTAGTVINGHLNQPPPQFPETVPPAAAAVVFQALAKRPEDRWPTAVAFAEASTNAAANPQEPHADPAQFGPAMPVATGPHPFDPPTVRTGSPRRSALRKRLLTILPTVVVAILAAVATLGLWPWLSDADDGSGDGDGGTLEARDESEDGGAPVGSGATAPGESASDASSAATTKDAEDAAETDGAEGAEETGVGGENEGGEEATEDEGGMVDGNPAQLPDVLGEWYTDAKAHLESEGWTNVVLIADSQEPDNGVSECGVYAQDPPSGSETYYDTQVNLYYWETFDGAC